METVQPGAVTRGSIFFPFPSLPGDGSTCMATGRGEAEPALAKLHRKPMGQVLFRELWENMFMPWIRAAPLAVAAE